MKKIRQTILFTLLPVMSGLALAACGNKGDLYLPDSEPIMQSASQADAAAAAKQ